MNPMQELLHTEELEINAQKKEDKIQIRLQKNFKSIVLTFENFRSGKIGSNFHYKDHTACGLN